MTTGLFLRLCVLVAAVAAVSACEGENEARSLASAKERLKKHDTAGATIDLKRVLQSNSESKAARLLLGKVLLEGNDPGGAELELRKALELGVSDELVLPDLARAMLTQGQGSKVTGQFASTTLRDAQAQGELRTWVAAAFAQTGDAARARAEIDNAFRASPDLAVAAIVGARLKADAGDIDGALSTLAALLQQDPANEEAGVARAYLLWLGKGDAAAAIDAHRKVLAMKPGSVAAQSEIVTLLFQQGKADEARKEFAQLQKIAPLHPQTQFFQAQFAYVDRQYGRARELTDALLKLYPDHVRAMELAAASEYHLGNDAQAQAFLARALKLMPGLVLSRQILAQSLARTGQPAKVIEVLSPLTEGDKADAQSLVLAGNAWLELGDTKKAEAAYARARHLAPKDARVSSDIAIGMLGGPRSDLALRELEQVAAGDSGPRADLGLISGRIAKQDYAGALQAIQALQAKVPEQAYPHQLRGQVLVAQRDAAGARRSFEAALALDRNYFPAVAALATMDVATGKADAARKRVSDFLARVPNHATAHTLLAEIPGPPGAGDTLTEGLKKAASSNPSDVKARMALIGRYMVIGDAKAALTEAQNASVALPNNLSIAETLGQAQLLAGEPLQASITFKRLASQQPGNARPHMLLGEALVASKDLDAARRAFAAASELDPSLGEARRAQAMIAMRQNQPEQALAIARDMQKTMPKEALGWAVEGDIEVQRRNYAAASAAFKTALAKSSASEAAIKLHATLLAMGKTAEAAQLETDWERQRPKDPPFHFHLGDLAMRQERWADAEMHYRRVLESQPKNGLAMNNVAWLLLKQSKTGALEMAQQANAAAPNVAPILDTLASIQAVKGQLDEAIKTQHKAMAASQQDPGLRLTLARYLVKAGKKDEAREQLELLARLGDKFKSQAEVTTMLKSL